MKSVCFAILNYNGVHHLEHLMPTAFAAAQGCPVVVLDNRSTQDDVRWLAAHFPAAETIVAPANDYVFSYHWLLARRTEEIVVLLNSDLRLDPGFLPPLLRHFEADDVFAVCATSRDWDDTRFTCGPARLRSHHGHYYWPYETERQERAHTLFASAGFMAVDRKKFLELDGFNPLFRPAYGEDLDLGFRAWRRGWRNIFEPASLVYHLENGSHGPRAARLIERSRLLFQWSTLPPAAPPLEAALFRLWRSLRQPSLGAIWLSTWREWQRVRQNYGSLNTSRAELDEIVRRIAAPVPTV
jgi:GT2 family glycosyltransferase